MTLRWHMVINFGVQSPFIWNSFKKWNFDIAAAVPDNNFSVQSFVLSDSSPMSIGFRHCSSTSGYKVSYLVIPLQWALDFDSVMEGCRWVWTSAGTFVLTAQLTWHLYCCTRLASVLPCLTCICTPVLDLDKCTCVLDWELFSCTQVAYHMYSFKIEKIILICALGTKLSSLTE